MTARQLVAHSLSYYWRSHLAVIAGVATAVAVMAGALLVGDSVRGSLRDLVLQRLGRTDRLVMSTTFFREELAGELNADSAFAAAHAAAPMIVLQGMVSDPSSGRRVSTVPIYGVDDRFWRFHGVSGRTGPADRDAFTSRSLAADLGVSSGGTILVRVQKPSAIPIESLHGRKDDPGRTLRLTVRDVIGAAQMGDFSVQPQQGSIRAVFVPLTRLQQDLDQPARVNTMLIEDRAAGTDDAEAAIRRHAVLADYGFTLRALEPQHAIAVESDAGVIDSARTDAIDRVAAASNLPVQPVLTYLANAIHGGGREVPYSLVTATDLTRVTGQEQTQSIDNGDTTSKRPIVLNEWTARDLGVKVGDPIRLDYYAWVEPGRLETRQTEFTLRAIVPLSGTGADRDFAPRYPGITDADTLGDWDPPFPIDLKRVRPADEEYWKQYRTTPKAFIAFADGADLWGTRYGNRTSIRVIVPSGEALPVARARFEPALLAALNPAAAGLAAQPVRARAVAASAGATDFGEYFVYFSFFLVVSALVLAALFFRLAVEQRAREVGLLRAVGFGPAHVRRLFTFEGVLLAGLGSAIGIGGAVGYAALMMAGLRTWWSGAVGTTALTLHVTVTSLLAGAAGALAAAVSCIWWALGGLSRVSERALLAGHVAGDSGLVRRRSLVAPITGAALAATALGLVIAASSGVMSQSEAFFGAGSAILGAGLAAAMVLLRRTPKSVTGHGWRSLARIGWRNASVRPGRSVLAIAVIASAAFIVISVDAFRRGSIDPTDPRSGTGGFPLLLNLDLPLVHDPNSRDGREALGVGDLSDVTFVPFRVLPGEDVSCLNLYQPTSPRILGASPAFVASGRFSFQSSLAQSDADRLNPWRLLEEKPEDGTIPVIADGNSMTYVLHKSLGDVVALTQDNRTLRLKIVAALSDSVLQGELVMSDANFITLFPRQQGYSFFLVDVASARAATVETQIEKGAADFGAEATPAQQRLDDYHAVENTYLSTFQTLGGLGLLVGTLGLAAVLLRNVLERRRELALLRAVGYQPSHVFSVIVAENAVLLGWGVALGAVAAAIAVSPAAMARGARLPISVGSTLLLGMVLAAGLLASIVATRVAIRAPLVATLRSE